MTGSDVNILGGTVGEGCRKSIPTHTVPLAPDAHIRIIARGDGSVIVQCLGMSPIGKQHQNSGEAEEGFPQGAEAHDTAVGRLR